MTTIHTIDTKPAIPRHALILFADGDDTVQHATLHKIRDGVIMPSDGPLTTHALQAINNSLQGLKTKASGRAAIQVMPTNILFRDTANAVTVWWRPSSPTPQFFNCKELGQIQGVTPMPSLVFAQSGLSLSVCAVAGNERPSSEMQVYHAPMFNTYDAGDVCLGGVRLKPVSESADIEENQSKFLRGVNTHPNGSHRKTQYEGGIFSLWRDLIADPSIGWNDAWLNPMKNMTLGQWMARL